MQLSIYYNREDEGLIEKIKAEATVERKSQSAVMLSILDEYFERRRKLGEILHSIAGLSDEQLNRALEIQRKGRKRRLLGEILLDEGFVEEKALHESLRLQKDEKR